jgi:hypothetical protein
VGDDFVPVAAKTSDFNAGIARPAQELHNRCDATGTHSDLDPEHAEHTTGHYAWGLDKIGDECRWSS